MAAIAAMRLPIRGPTKRNLKFPRCSGSDAATEAGAEAGGEVDTATSVFAAVQIAESAPEPTVVFIGGLTALTPPAQDYRFHGRLVALVRSDDPGQILPAEAAWARWVHTAGGSFEALSSNDAPAAIAQALLPGRG